MSLRDDELILVGFAGGGGSSEGIRMALGREIDIAINHDPLAVAVHAANHPATAHHCQSIWQAKPSDVVGLAKGASHRKVGLAWFSPDCRHFSKAKGGKPVEKRIRDLAWVVVAYAKDVRPRVIMLENVEEFQDWGPLLENSMPDPDKRGLEFRRWLKELKKLGYKVDWRELRACDYGAPTIRKRFFLIARCDGEPIRWPKPTHAAPDKLRPGQKPWRTAAECIDWSIPCPSIFLTREEGRAINCNRPLADATMRRIARGVDRYVIKAAKPFLVPVTHPNDARTYGADEPARTVTGANRGEQAVVVPTLALPGFRCDACGEHFEDPHATGIGTLAAAECPRCGEEKKITAAPFLVPITHTTSGDRVRPIDEGLRTITTAKGGELALATPFLARTDMASAAERNGIHAPGEPIRTVTSAGGFAVVSPTIVSVAHSTTTGRGPNVWPAEDPLRTTTGGNDKALVAPLLTPYYGERREGEARAHDPADPLKTQTTENRFGLVAPYLVPRYGERPATETSPGQEPRVMPADAPIATIVPTQNQGALAAVHLTKFRGGATGSSANEPVPTVTANSYVVRPGGAPPMGVVAAFLAQHNTGVVGHEAEEPVSTIVGKGCTQAVVAANLTKFQENGAGKHPEEPLDTVMAGAPRHGVVTSHLTSLRGTCKDGRPADAPMATPTGQGWHLAEVRAFLMAYYGSDQDTPCDEPMHTATAKARFGLVTVEGVDYQIVDIGMRMLAPRELYNAQGFRPDYIIDPIVDGKRLSKTAQIKCVGNSVCPDVAAALVRANFAEPERAQEVAD